MEEARQHPPVGLERLALVTLYGAGLLAAVAGLVLQFSVGGHALQIGLLALAACKVVLGVWELARPHSFKWNERSRLYVAIATILWLAIGASIGLSFWRAP